MIKECDIVKYYVTSIVVAALKVDVLATGQLAPIEDACARLPSRDMVYQISVPYWALRNYLFSFARFATSKMMSILKPFFRYFFPCQSSCGFRVLEIWKIF